MELLPLQKTLGMDKHDFLKFLKTAKKLLGQAHKQNATDIHAFLKQLEDEKLLQKQKFSLYTFSSFNTRLCLIILSIFSTILSAFVFIKNSDLTSIQYPILTGIGTIFFISCEYLFLGADIDEIQEFRKQLQKLSANDIEQLQSMFEIQEERDLQNELKNL